MPHRNHRSDHPALQAAARLPAYIVLALMIVAVSAGGLLAARGNGTQSTPAGAADAVESQLPTPVPPSETPLPTPIPLDQSVIVDTAVAFWVEFVPEELAIEYHEEIVAAGGVPWLSAGGSGTASTSATASPRPTPTPTRKALPAVTRPGAPVPSPSIVPLPDPPALATPAPLPEATLPAVPLPLPTLPPVLPLLP